MRDLRKYEELFPEEFLAIQAKTPICYWACGPMEYHGLQNTLGIDPAKAYEICLRAASISGGIVFPLVPFAPLIVALGEARRRLENVDPEAAASTCASLTTAIGAVRTALQQGRFVCPRTHGTSVDIDARLEPAQGFGVFVGRHQHGFLLGLTADTSRRSC